MPSAGQPGTQEKRNDFRYEMVYPVIYTRFDDQGREFDQRPSKLMNMSLGGVGLLANSPVDPGEMLDISMALEDVLVAYQDRLVSFLGKVIYLIPSQDQTIRLGISIEKIKDRERCKINDFIHKLFVSNREHGGVITQQGDIVCPNCGERVERVGRVKEVTAYYGEFWDQCSCGQRYEAKPRSSDTIVLLFPDKQLEIIC